jgi:hypothetical protein
MKRKQGIFFGFAVLLTAAIFTLAGCDNGTNSTTPGGTTPAPEDKPLVEKVGDPAVYGTYNGKAVVWQCIAVDTSDVKNQKALLISKDVIATKPYNETNTEVSWETCTIRTWLNGEFYNSAFNGEQKAKILETTVSTPANSEYGTSGGNDTKDRVFLLSEPEAKQYFPTDESRKCDYPGDDEDGNLWWLRTPGENAATVLRVELGGDFYLYGASVQGDDPKDTKFNGVRPAIWVDITPKDESDN